MPKYKVIENLKEIKMNIFEEMYEYKSSFLFSIIVDNKFNVKACEVK